MARKLYLVEETTWPEHLGAECDCTCVEDAADVSSIILGYVENEEEAKKHCFDATLDDDDFYVSRSYKVIEALD